MLYRLILFVKETQRYQLPPQITHQLYGIGLMCQELEQHVSTCQTFNQYSLQNTTKWTSIEHAVFNLVHIIATLRITNIEFIYSFSNLIVDMIDAKIYHGEDVSELIALLNKMKLHGGQSTEMPDLVEQMSQMHF